MIDTRMAFADDLARLLPGEEVLAMESVAYFAGKEDKYADVPETIMEKLDSLVWNGLPSDGAEEMVAGHSREALPGSMADQLARACDGPRQLIVTDRELVLVDSTATWNILFRCPLTAVAVSPAPRLFQAGRLRAVFVDGSWTMLVAGLLTGRGARRIVDAHQRALGGG